MNKAFRGTREHGIQFVWYQNEDENQPGRSLLYEELAKDHNLNKAGFLISLFDLLKDSTNLHQYIRLNKTQKPFKARRSYHPQQF